MKKSNYYMISTEDGSVLFEYGISKKEVRMFVQRYYPNLSVVNVERIK